MFSSEEKKHYSRHFLLKGFGREGQQLLKKSRVLLVGAGGLGCPAALYLAAAGVGKIIICDDDNVEVSNLQRQVAFTYEDVGLPKADVLAKRLRQMNPFIEVDARCLRVTKDNVKDLLEQVDLVLDGCDNFTTRYLMNDACYFAGTALVSGAISQFEGQLTVFPMSEGNACYRCLFPQAPQAGEVPNCAEAGVLGVLPGTLGAMMATEAVKYLAEIGETLEGRLLIYDSLQSKTLTMAYQASGECPLCSEKATIHELIEEENSMCSTQRQGIEELDVFALKQKMEAGEEFFLLDVRQPEEWQIASIEGAVLIPMNEVPSRLEEIPQDKEIVLYCHHGMRSLHVAQYLESEGYSQLFNLQGGIHLWAVEIASGMPTY